MIKKPVQVAGQHANVTGETAFKPRSFDSSRQTGAMNAGAFADEKPKNTVKVPADADGDFFVCVHVWVGGEVPSCVMCDV